jgi:penicillin-binding protein 1A
MTDPTSATPQDSSPQSTWAYLRYRVNRDIGLALAWFREKWRASRLFRVLASLLAVGLALWIAIFV